MQRLIFLVIAHFPAGCLATGAERESSWRALTSQDITDYQAAVSGRSTTECIRECRKYSHCSRVTFHPSTATCYLLPSAASGPSTGLTTVYQDKGQSFCIR